MDGITSRRVRMKIEEMLEFEKEAKKYRVRAENIILSPDKKKVLVAGHRKVVFPGGGIEEGQTPQEAASREAEEEINVRSSNHQIARKRGTKLKWTKENKQRGIDKGKGERTKKFKGSKTNFDKAD